MADGTDRLTQARLRSECGVDAPNVDRLVDVGILKPLGSTSEVPRPADGICGRDNDSDCPAVPTMVSKCTSSLSAMGILPRMSASSVCEVDGPSVT